MRNYLFFIITIIHLAISCTQEAPGKRVEPNSALGRREQMEQRMEEKLQNHEIYPMNPAEGKKTRQGSK